MVTVQPPQSAPLQISPPALDIIEPIGPIGRQWRWALRWWAALITVLTLHIPVFVLLVGFEVITLPNVMFITYVSAATGGNTLLAITGILLLKPFALVGVEAEEVRRGGSN